MHKRTIADILDYLMSRDGIGPKELERQTGVKHYTISRIRSGQINSPRDDKVRPLADHFRVTTDQLRGYAPLLTDQVNDTVSTYNAVPGPRLRGQVPLIDWVQAGNWAEPADLFHPGDAETWLPCPFPHSDSTYALRVQGISMEDEFKEGDIIIVDPERTPDPGKFVVAKRMDTQEATFKQLIKEGEEYLLKAYNPDWPQRIIRMNDTWTVCGVVIGKTKQY